jgi:hypothetical protein
VVEDLPKILKALSSSFSITKISKINKCIYIIWLIFILEFIIQKNLVPTLDQALHQMLRTQWQIRHINKVLVLEEFTLLNGDRH